MKSGLAIEMGMVTVHELLDVGYPSGCTPDGTLYPFTRGVFDTKAFA